MAKERDEYASHRIRVAALRPLGSVLIALLMLCAPAVASGAVTHAFLGGVGEVPIGARTVDGGVASTGPVENIESLTVDGGDSWITSHDAGQLVHVDEFDASSRTWLAQLDGPPSIFGPFAGVAVDHTTGESELYHGASVAGSGGAVAVYGLPSGEFQGLWKGEDTPDGSFAKSAGGGKSASVSDVAVDESGLLGDWASGDVYVSTRSIARGVVDVFKPLAGGGEKYVAQLTGTEGKPFVRVLGVAVDRASGDLFVADEQGVEGASVVDAFEPVAGMEGVYRFLFELPGTPAGIFGESNGLAVDGAAGDLYVGSEIGGEAGVFEFRLGGGGSSASYVGRLTSISSHLFGADPVVGVDESDHDVFVGTTEKGVVTEAGYPLGVVGVFGPDVVLPDVVSLGVSSVGVSGGGVVGAQLNGSVDPLGEGAVECWFVWGASRVFGRRADCPGVVPDSNGVVGVHAVLGKDADLLPDTRYWYRLQASDKNGMNLGENGQDQEFVTPGPGLHGSWVSDVASSSATFNARVDPHGAPASVHFQYGTSSSYGSVSPAVDKSVSLGSGSGDVVVPGQHVQGLSPGTTYHYRLVVVGEVEGRLVSFYGPDRIFSTQSVGVVGGSVLPDGRAWELVSPAIKHGALIEAIGREGIIQAAAGGGAFTFHTNQPTETMPAGYANQVQLLAVRGPGGWSSKDVAVAHEPATGKAEGVGEDYRFFSEDLSFGVVQPTGGFIASGTNAIASGEASEQTAFLRTDFTNTGSICASSCYRPLVTGCPKSGESCLPSIESLANVPPGTRFGEEGLCPDVQASCGPFFEAASPDGERIILHSDAQLTKTPTLGDGELYEWNAPTNSLSLVSVIPGPGGTETPASTSVEMQGFVGSATRAVSSDGNRVFWEEPFGGHHLYMTDTLTGKSVQLDTPVEGASGGGIALPKLQAASADGSRVIFTDTQQLTSDSGAGEDQPDLYECVMVEMAGMPVCRLADLTPAVNGEEPAAVQGGVLGSSEDLGWVYFVANGALAPGAVNGNCGVGLGRPTPEQLCNVYVRHEGVTKLVAVISGADRTDWGVLAQDANLEELTARVSPGGGWLAFMSDRELTGYDNHDSAAEWPDEEVYLYDAETGKLSCASCMPSGARPEGTESSGTSSIAASIPGWTAYRVGRALYQSRYLSDSGRLFFNSPDALVPQDVNGTWDVYEYEPSGVGDCSMAGTRYSSLNNGCLGLISSGESGAESSFLDASETGGEVFFLTTARLAREDHDTAYDVYDAHECTPSSPCIQEAPQAPPPCTTASACRAPATPQPEVFGAPASATFQGPANSPTPPPPPAANKPPPPPLPPRAQQLAKALKACHKDHDKRQRKHCERTAHRHYGGVRRPG